MPKTKVGTFRNMRLMEGRTDLWQFEVRDKSGNWHTLTNLGNVSEEDRNVFAQKTADRWVTK